MTPAIRAPNFISSSRSCVRRAVLDTSRERKQAMLFQRVSGATTTRLAPSSLATSEIRYGRLPIVK